MWATRLKAGNDLYRLAAGTGLLLALFLFAGASGHLVAIWPHITADGPAAAPVWRLIVPGLVLALACFANGILAPALWQERVFARNSALLINALCALYLAYLLNRGVPDHPIGIFLCLVLHQLILLAAIYVGLVWSGAAHRGDEATSSQPD